MTNLYKGKEAKLNRLASLKNPYAPPTLVDVFLLMAASDSRSYAYATESLLIKDCPSYDGRTFSSRLRQEPTKRKAPIFMDAFFLAAPDRLELTTLRLTAACSTY